MRRYRQASGFFEDAVGGFGPDEGLGIIVVFLEVSVDGGLKVDDGAEHAATQAAAGEGGEEGLDGVEPGDLPPEKWTPVYAA